MDLNSNLRIKFEYSIAKKKFGIKNGLKYLQYCFRGLRNLIDFYMDLNLDLYVNI